MPLHSKSQPPLVILATNTFANWSRMMTMIGISLLLMLTSTAALLQEEIDTSPRIPLTSSVMYEQYDNGRLYNTHFEAPYNQHLCQPRKIHLSPASDIDPVSGLYNATVSFTLNFTKALAGEPLVKNLVRTRVNYGRGDSEEGSIVIDYDEGDFVEHKINKITEDYTLVRFNYTSPTDGEYYHSDLIHHVLLKDLKAGKQRYWYNIRVEFVQKDFVSGPSSSQTSFPPLMKPMKNWHSTPHPLTTRFFLRGDYEYARKLGQHPQAQSKEQQELSSVSLVGETPLYEFTTPPLYGAPTSIALVGDLGQTVNSTRTMARILGAATAGSYEKSTIAKLNGDEKDDHRLVTNLFIAGDLSYSDGDPERWESWLDLAEPLLREVPFASVPGNHEIECDKTTYDVFVPYESFFRNPNRIQEAIEVPPSKDYIDALHGWCTTPSEFMGLYDYGNAYFSYRQGLVHTIFLNSYASLVDGSKQREWLMNTALPEVDRALTPWLVVVFHTPLYTTFSNHYGELNPKIMMTSGMRQVFERYKVNLVVSGHDHAYLRTKPLDANGIVANNTGTVFWTLGAGGNREGHAKYRNPDQPEGWVAQRNNDEFGFGLFFAPNATHAHLQWMRDDDSNDDSSLMSPGNSSLVMRDSVWIENTYN